MFLDRAGRPAGSTGGIALNQADTSGRTVYGVSTTDGKVFVLNTATGQTLSAWGIEKGILTPDDLVVSANGTIYYTDTLGGFVGKIVPDQDPAPPDNTVMTRLNNPQTQPLFLVNSIALSDDETHLYAGVCFFLRLRPVLIVESRQIAHAGRLELRDIVWQSHI